MSKKDFNHTPTDEIEFINHLGTYSNGRYDPILLLKGYLEGLELREEWGDLHKPALVWFAKKRLKKLEGKKSKSVLKRAWYDLYDGKLEKVDDT